MDILSNILWFGVALGLLIFLHEAGHFIIARRTGVKVEVFSLGFGPRLFGWERGGTTYQVSAVPLGGYVKMLGEEPETGDADAPSAPPTNDPRSFAARTRWERSKILLAGPGTNLIIAYVLAVTVFVVGIQESAYFSAPPVAGYIEPDSPAAKAGLVAGDRILSLNGEAIPTFKALTEWTALRPNQVAMVVWEHDGEKREARAVLAETERYRTGYLGVAPVIPFRVAEVEPNVAAWKAGLWAGDTITSVDGEKILNVARGHELLFSKRLGEHVRLVIKRGNETFEMETELGNREGSGYLDFASAPPPTIERRYPVPQAFAEGFRWMGEQTRLLGRALSGLFSGNLSLRTMSGPVDIAKFSGAAARTSPSTFIYFVAFLSLNLGIMNLLPIPVLDGGHLFLIAIEGARRRDLSMAFKERFMQVGFVFLLTLMGAIVALDLIKNIF